MITEWQPIMPDDKLKLKSRCIYEFLCSNHRTFLVVGRGVDREVEANVLITDDDVVGYREYDCRPVAMAEPKAQGKKP